MKVSNGVSIVVSLIQINNIISSPNNTILRKVNVKPYGSDNMYMDKDLVEYKLFHIINQFNERGITSVKFYSILLNKVSPFYDKNGRSSKIPFANDERKKQKF